MGFMSENNNLKLNVDYNGSWKLMFRNISVKIKIDYSFNN